MKKFLIFILSSSIFQTVMGQIENPITKGTILAGGTLSLNFENNKEFHPQIDNIPEVTITNKIKSLETDLYFGYFVSRHFVLGVITDVSMTKRKYENSLTMKSYDYIYYDIAIGPFLRYYTIPGIFFEASTSFGFFHYTSAENPVNWNNFSYSTGIGYSFLLTKSVALEPEIKYTHLYRNPYELEDSKEVSNSLQFTIGLQFYLNNKDNND
jgi:opacity protein-like surface antigen